MPNFSGVPDVTPLVIGIVLTTGSQLSQPRA
jgi:hypothetical protein